MQQDVLQAGANDAVLEVANLTVEISVPAGILHAVTDVSFHVHQGETLGYVLEGELELTIETTTYNLGPGDSFFFKNHLTNRYRNTGTVAAKVIWVNTPQVH